MKVSFVPIILALSAAQGIAAPVEEGPRQYISRRDADAEAINFGKIFRVGKAIAGGVLSNLLMRRDAEAMALADPEAEAEAFRLGRLLNIGKAILGTALGNLKRDAEPDADAEAFNLAISELMKRDAEALADPEAFSFGKLLNIGKALLGTALGSMKRDAVPEADAEAFNLALSELMKRDAEALADPEAFSFGKLLNIGKALLGTALGSMKRDAAPEADPKFSFRALGKVANGLMDVLNIGGSIGSMVSKRDAEADADAEAFNLALSQLMKRGAEADAKINWGRIGRVVSGAADALNIGSTIGGLFSKRDIDELDAHLAALLAAH